MSGKAFTITRSFPAPRALVFEAFTRQEHLLHWWGPKGMSMIHTTLDLRPGGMFHYGMRAPNGAEMWGRFVFEEISPPERLVFVSGFSDPQGGLVHHSMAPQFPLEVRNVVTFAEQDGRTTVTLTGGPVGATDEQRAFYESLFDSMQGGFTGTFDQLERFLEEAPRSFALTHLYDAPLEQVYEAWTKPEHIEKWWGPDGYHAKVHEMDVRPGGRWRFLLTGPDGTQWPSLVLYDEVVPLARLAYRHGGESQGDIQDPFHVIVTFEARGEKTHVTMRGTMTTVAAFEFVKGFGAIEKGHETLSHLDAHLLTMARS
jgi:uncharacterized protein YndB with AHSA1/START domain